MAALPQAPPTIHGVPTEDAFGSKVLAAELGMHPLQNWIFSESHLLMEPCARLEHDVRHASERAYHLKLFYLCCLAS